MKEKNWLWLVVAGVSLFGIFVILSVVTLNTDTVQRVFVILSEVFGVVTLAFSIWGWVKIPSQKWLYIAPVAFLGSWLMIGIAYEIGFDATMDHGWVWFLVYYIVAVASSVLLRFSIGKTEGKQALMPISMLFVQSIQIVYVIIIHIIWMLPF
ncbi:hypothetical protein [Salimicrobium halophilum]|uniref:Uncharacterized protein n=1 Tax=Salimicrobium halophilum TaxID=86666 RepID=A0A1G8TK15_9BACI|nr:hypothetical protein [Salimicrobium halophilum]SDJ41922.1 hypothetical protein SAMN04490247_1830 [Salimicrobium halophilum]